MKILNYFSNPVLQSVLTIHNKFLNILGRKQLIQKYTSASFKNIQYSQATPYSHPHILKAGEVTPGISAEVYKNRRQKTMENIVQTNPTGNENTSAHLVVIPSSSVVYMSENIPYPFRQSTDFLYLCGYNEPNSVLVLHTVPGRSLPEYECILFITRQSSHSVKWEGLKMCTETVTMFLGIDRALYLDDLEKFLETFVKSNKKFTVWYDYMRTPFQYVQDIMSNFLTSYSGNLSVESPRPLLHKLRLIKSDVEAQLMRRTCKIAAESLKEVIKFSYPNISESHLQARMEYECRLKGANQIAFPPVVAGEDRANTIHYIENNNIVKDFEMVLIDAGCEYHGYLSDMARTWPVNGKFTDSQTELYEVVLSVQKQLIEMCSTDMSLDHLFEIMCCNLGKGFQELGVIPKSASKQQVKEAAYDLCPHHVSHYLGMDVHDTDLISRNIPLQSGMVVTVEPGVYISKSNTNCPENYRGLCIRIEDDILITDGGYEVLTADCPKEIDDIENLCQINEVC